MLASSGTIFVTYSSNVYLIKEDDEMSQALLEFGKAIISLIYFMSEFVLVDNPLTAAGISEDGCLLVVGDR